MIHLIKVLKILKGGDKMKKYIVGTIILIFTLALISGIFATNIQGNNYHAKKCTDYFSDNCLQYSYHYEYVCIHYNPYDCSWRKVKFEDKCIRYRTNSCY